jgi:hypothetical protein
MTSGQYSMLALIVLLDAAPVPSCGTSSRTELLIQAADCSCISEQLEVFVDDKSVGQLRCGWSLPTQVAPGSHVVGGRDSAKTWPQQSVSVREGETVTVRLACP